MDKTQSEKAMENGADSAMKGGVDLADGVHESANQTSMTDTSTSVFDKSGAIGKHFNADGTVGGTAQKIGGPFDKEGMVGKQFNADGAIGGTAQRLADKNQGSV